MRSILFSSLIWFCFSVKGMQQPIRVYNPQKTLELQSLLNRHRQNLPVPVNEIKTLIATGANPNCKAGSGYYINHTWLQSLIDRTTAKRHEDVIIFLIQNGSVLNDWEEVSPLHDASMLGLMKIIPVLIAHGAEVNAKTTWGDSALLLAVTRDYHALVELLLKNGAATVINDANDEGHSPLSWAKAHKAQFPCMLKLLESYNK